MIRVKNKSCPEAIVRRIHSLLSDKQSWMKLSEFDIRSNYILPMFKYLGWNVDNEGLSPFDFEVLQERSIRSGRPDITFRINGLSVFFVETKNIKKDLTDKDIFQAWQYAWTSGHRFTILSNFLQTWFIDTRSTPPIKPKHSLRSQILFQWNTTNLIKQWDKILSLIGRKAIENGSLDALEEALNSKSKKIKGIDLTLFPMEGAFPVDRYFLGQLDQWRLRLVRNIYASCPHWNREQVIETADQLLNLIVFIRVLEDKKLERKLLLKEVIEKAEKHPGLLLAEINRVRSNLDVKYNGTVFKALPSDLILDETILGDIIANIYPPNSPYLLNYLPIEMLGTIYERFLGTSIEFDKGKICISEQRASQKESGIFYTERYITNFMLTQILSPFLKDKNPHNILNLRIADISCGSGSFLISVFKNLIFWLEHVCQEKDEWREEFLERNKDGSWKLQLQKKIDILSNCIYGIDIDPEAVNVTRFSLYLQALEGETSKTVKELWNKKQKPILPVLDRNIQCGNSLVRYEIVEEFLPNTKERKTINPFNLEESFNEIFQEGGFNIIVGNPPYNAKITPVEKNYFHRFKLSKGNLNTANLFIERTEELIRKSGGWCLIVPKSLIYSEKWLKTRKYLQPKINFAVDASKAFKKVRLEQVIIGSIPKNRKFLTGKIEPTSLTLFKGINSLPFSDIIPVNITKKEINIGLKISEKTDPMIDYFFLKRGNIPISSLRETGEIKVLQGRFVQGYAILNPDKGIAREQAVSYIEAQPIWKCPKIVAQQIVAHCLKPHPHVRLIGSIDFSGLLSVDTVSNIFPRVKSEKEDNLKFLMLFALGIFNSRITSWYADRFVYAKAIRTMHLDNYHLRKLRFPKKSLLQTNQAKKIVSLVEERLKLRPTTSASGREKFIRESKHLEAMIDSNVAKLLGLDNTDLEIINNDFGEECLGELGRVLKSMTFIDVESNKLFNKQLGLWKLN